MTFGSSDDSIPVSALEHFSYCPRQCALIHVERVWDENLYTMRGRDVHTHVDEESSQDIGGVKLERALPIWSRRLNLVGIADLVEFHGETPYPVEYKSGRLRKGIHESLQLCAQALCLEDMFSVAVPCGAIYWHGSRERIEICFTDEMRSNVKKTAEAVAEMLVAKVLPKPVNDKRCKDCSLRSSCLPTVVTDGQRRVKSLKALFEVSP